MDSWWYTWFPLLAVFLILFLQKGKQKKIAAKLIQGKGNKKIMQELVKRFIGKDCYINLLDGTVDGVLREITDGGLVIEKDGKQQAVNLNYVMKIREYPHNKKGKRALVSGG